MWFKNLAIYDLETPFGWSLEDLQAVLSEKRIRSTTKTQWFTMGWVSPFSDQVDPDSVFVHSVMGGHLLRVCKEMRILPAAVIQQTVAERVLLIEAKENRKVYRKERMRIKDDVLFDLLPKAFTRRVYHYLYIDTEYKTVCVDVGHRGQAELMLQFLRDTLGGLTLALPEFQITPTQQMTQWLLHGQTPADLQIKDSCELVDKMQGGGVIRCSHQELVTPEIQLHVKEGKHVVKLALVWKDRLRFVLTEDLVFKRLQCLDQLETVRKAEETETPAQRIDVDFTLMLGEFRALLDSLKHWLAEPHLNSAPQRLEVVN
jgi:recombination associated protein RdgC